MALDASAINAALQEHYETRRPVIDACERNNPFYGRLRKLENVGGDGMKTPVMARNSTGGSATFSDAQTNAAAGGYYAFLQTHREHWHTASISHQALKLTSYKEAFFSAKKEIDRSLNQVANAISRKLFGDTGGSFARVANSSFATTDMQLVRIQDAYHFEKNEVLKLGPNKDGSSIRSGTLTVASVNRLTGVVTTTQNLSTGVAAVQQNDYIFKQGDQALGLTGLESFNPVSASDLTTLHSVVQTDDPTRLGGQRIDATGMTVVEAIIELASVCSYEGGLGDDWHCFINPRRFKDLNLACEAGRLARREVKSASGYIGYSAFVASGPGGDITILQDVNCPPSDLRMVDMGVLCLKSAGGIHIASEDGNMMLRGSTSMNYETRIGFIGDLTCEAPVRLGVAKLSATSA